MQQAAKSAGLSPSAAAGIGKKGKAIVAGMVYNPAQQRKDTPTWEVWELQNFS
jgi:hypothetical protein